MGDCQSGACGSQDSAKQQQEAEIKNTLSKIKHKLIVMSGKGGVGKTSVSVNLAIALAKKGYQVGIMDVDLHGPDVPRMLGLKGEVAASKDMPKLTPMSYSDNLKAISMECFMPNKDDAVIWRGPLKHSAINQFITDIDWGELDFLIVDSPPGTGDEPLSVIQILKKISGVIIVSTPQELAYLDVRKAINFAKKLEIPILGIVENMTEIVCPHCGQRIELFKAGSGEKALKDFNIDLLGRIPFDVQVVQSGDTGKPFIGENANTEAGKIFTDIADKIAAKL